MEDSIWVPVYTTPEEFSWKRSFISPVRPSVHTNPEILSTENGAFRKRSWKRRNLKTELCVLVWRESNLKTDLFENDDVSIIMWFVCPSLPQTQIQNGGRNGVVWTENIYPFSSADEKHLMHFQNETTVFKFLRRSEDRVWLKLGLGNIMNIVTSQFPESFVFNFISV